MDISYRVKHVELRDLTEYVEGADEQQLRALAYMASWLNEMGMRYCRCSVRCNTECEVVKAMGEAFEAATSRLKTA